METCTLQIVPNWANEKLVKTGRHKYIFGMIIMASLLHEKNDMATIEKSGT